MISYMSIEIIFLLAVFLGIPTLIRFNILSVENRLYLLFGTFAVMTIIGFSTLTLSVMGFTSKNFVQGFLPWAAVTLFMLAGIWMAAVLLQHKHANDPLRDPHFLFLFIPISIVQQFMYQSVLLQKLLQGFDPLIAITICAFCFGYMHTIFPRRWRNFVLASLGGLLFSSLFYFYPNFALAIVSHMILNVAAVYFGFFTLLTPEGKPRATKLYPIRFRA